MVRINWDSIVDTTTAVLPDGDYMVKVVDAEEKPASTGSEMISLKLQVQHGPHAGKWVWDNVVFSGKALPRLRIIGKAFGFNMAGEADITAQMFLGKVVMITTKQETYGGKTRAKVPFDGYAPATDYCPAGQKSASEVFDGPRGQNENEDIPF